MAARHKYPYMTVFMTTEQRKMAYGFIVALRKSAMGTKPHQNNWHYAPSCLSLKQTSKQ